MRLLLKDLNINSLPYNPACDPTRQSLSASELWQDEFTKREWTIGPRAVNATRKRLAVRLEHKNENKPKNKKAKASDTNIKEETEPIDEGVPVKVEDNQNVSIKDEPTGDNHETSAEHKHNNGLTPGSTAVSEEKFNDSNGSATVSGTPISSEDRAEL